jgi:large subunit ribosomal protein L15
MDLSNLQPKTTRKNAKRIGRGGKRGFSSGKGTKGQKAHAQKGIRPGFRGGDNRIWQLFPKQKGASKKPGSSRPHTKHRFFRLAKDRRPVINLNLLNTFKDGQHITPELLMEQGIVHDLRRGIKILSDGELTKKLEISKEFSFSKSAKTKVTKSGSVIK